MAVTLSDKTKVGLTFGQIIALVGVFATIGLSWMDMNVRMANVELEIQQVKTQREFDVRATEVFRVENREDHAELYGKIDAIYRVIVMNQPQNN